MAAPAKIGYIVLDASDPERLAEFWCSLLGVEVLDRLDEGRYLVLSIPDGDRPGIALQLVPEPKAGKNRMHLDLMVEDLDVATALVSELGGSWREPDETRELEGYRWRCMADPEGNEFDIVPRA